MMGSIKTPGDGIDEWFEKQRLLAEQVKVSDGCIVVSVHYDYNIPLDACETYEQIIKWTWQLAEKSWASKEVIMMFIKVACTHHKLQYRL